jgi:hypothetical protein
MRIRDIITENWLTAAGKLAKNTKWSNPLKRLRNARLSHIQAEFSIADDEGVVHTVSDRIANRLHHNKQAQNFLKRLLLYVEKRREVLNFTDSYITALEGVDIMLKNHPDAFGKVETQLVLDALEDIFADSMF